MWRWSRLMDYKHEVTGSIPGGVCSRPEEKLDVVGPVGVGVGWCLKIREYVRNLVEFFRAAVKKFGQQ